MTMSFRLVSCKCIPTRLLTRIMTTMIDRLRFPWRGGAKRIMLDAVIPIILLPLLGYIAAHGVWTSILVFTSLPSFLLYMHYFSMKCYSQTKFFAVWALMSITCVVCVFELIGVVLLEIRSDEKIAFVVLTFSVFISIVKTKANAELSHIRSDMKLLDSKEYEMICSICCKNVPPRTFHCRICHTCIIKRDLHCAWLDCCIGESNHKWYLLSLISTISLLTLCSNLILTTACHPFVVWANIMLPDDCTDVYFDILYAVCFVTAIYCLLCIIFLMALLLHECWMISLGVTGQEWRHLDRKYCLGLCSTRPYSEGFCRNWVRYFKVRKQSVLTQTV